MSAENGTAPVPASSGFSVWTFVRIAGIIVGIATLLRVATNEQLVTYDPLFLAWMDWLSDIVELGFLTKLIGPFLHGGIEWVRSFGISVPDLQDEWRPAFVLSTLMFAAIARHSRSGLLVVAAPVGALVIAVWSGLDGSLLPIAVATIAAAAAVTVVFAVAQIAVTGALVALVVVVFVATLVVVSVAALAYADANVVSAAAIVAEVGLALLFFGIVWSRVSGGFRAQFANASFNSGIDILGVMLGALGVASLFANPPIW